MTSMHQAAARRGPAEAGAAPVDAGAAASSSSRRARTLVTAPDHARSKPEAGTTGWWHLLPAALAILSGAAAIVHLAVAGEHFAEDWAAGVFLFGVAIFQGTWALLVARRPSARLLEAGALVNAGVVAVWAISRTTGLPVGPERGAPEPVGFTDALVSGYEVLIVAGALALRRRRASSPTRSMRAATIALSVAVVALTATFLWLGEYVSGGHGGAVETIGHHLFHLLLIGGAAIVFAGQVALQIRNQGPVRFSWRLRPPPEGAATGAAASVPMSSA